MFEVFEMSPELQNIISQNFSIQNIIKEARAQGMIALREDGVLKALKGKVLIEEVIRETEEM